MSPSPAPKLSKESLDNRTYVQTCPSLSLRAWIKKGEPTHQIGVKRTTGETTHGEKTQGRESTQGWNDSGAKRPGTEHNKRNEGVGTEQYI